MTYLLRSLAGMLVLVVLSACSDPAESIQIRPGIGSDVDLERLQPPSGVTYRYSVENNGLPVPVLITLKSRKLSRTRYDYRGNVAFTFPDEVNFDEVGNLVADAFGVKDIRFRGNTAVFDIQMRTDNRFRSTSASVLSDSERFEPHDCYGMLGKCAYTVRLPGDVSFKLVTTTTEKDGIWRSTTRAAPENPGPGVILYTYSMDRNGVLIDAVERSKGFGDRSVTVYRRK